MTIVVLGDLMVDVVTRVSEPLANGSDTPARITVQGGGSAANVAAWAAYLGTPVSLVCRVGRDDRGRAAVAELRGVDVHVTVDHERATGTCVVLVEPGGERTMLPDPGANDAPLGEIPLGTHLHVVGYALLRAGPRASALAAIERARAAGMTVSVDPSSWALLRPGAIPDVDLLLPNEREAGLVEGEMVVKLGARGARWGELEVPAEAVEVVDTTGAGDAFAAGFLTARLQGADRREALEAGCHVAARVVTQVGARPQYDDD
ncbi:MAG TPA: carbohydrate kinase family protein [Solirubrobacteraceae bacterium]|jgi:ribokinase|nr:carbohydrate kinase family protein [Solirubrobacteraceae bacterium]